jgi:hypothetical protein
MNGRTMTGMGLACGVCCALPMLTAAGALSLGTVAFAGIAAGGVTAVGAITLLVVQRRATRLPGSVLMATFVVGAALSAWGLALLASGASRGASSFVTAGLALLACVTLLRLPSTTARR